MFGTLISTILANNFKIWKDVIIVLQNTFMLMDLTLVYEDLRKKLHEIFGIALKLWRNWFGAFKSQYECTLSVLIEFSMFIECVFIVEIFPKPLICIIVFGILFYFVYVV